MGAHRPGRRASSGLRLTGASEDHAAGRARRVLYGRRRGRPLRPGRQALIETLLPRLEIVLEPGGSPIQPATLFPFPCQDVWLEIGFGSGEHLTAQARAAPKTGFIGCEPFINGVASLLVAVDAEKLTNIRIFRDDARLLLGRLAEKTIGRAFVLFPDPWPKTRHHKRRIVAPETVAHLARIMTDGAELRIATDDPDYKGWILAHVLESGAFEWCARRPGDWRCRPGNWPETRYEAKARGASRTPSFFRFRRRPRSD